MEQAIKKLMEIEKTAKSIMQEATQNKKWLTEQMEQSCLEYDTVLDKETETKLQKMKDSLEEEKEAALAELTQKTEETLKELDFYYAQNHERLSKELFEKILTY